MRAAVQASRAHWEAGRAAAARIGGRLLLARARLLAARALRLKAAAAGWRLP
jgi:hypothetical protein